MLQTSRKTDKTHTHKHTHAHMHTTPRRILHTSNRNKKMNHNFSQNSCGKWHLLEFLIPNAHTTQYEENGFSNWDFARFTVDHHSIRFT